MNVSEINFHTVNPENFNPKIYYIVKEEVTQPTETYYSREYASLIHLLSGSCNYHIGSKKYTASAGDIIICNPGVTHSKEPLPGSTPVEFNIGIFDFCISNLPENCLLPPDSYPIVKLETNAKRFTSCCKEILEEGASKETGKELVLKALSLKLIALFIKERYGGNLAQKNQLKFKSNDKYQIVQTIINYIENNYMEDISLDTISKNMYLSSVYISKLFKEQTGASPINHLIKVRLAKATELLETTNLSIKTVSEMVGYNDAYYFSKLFKKYYGYSPSKVVKRIQ